MKRSDRIFIACMVIIVCLAWIYWLQQFWKSRNFNWINVTWKATAYVTADSVTANINFMWTWDTPEMRRQKVESLYSGFKEAISWLNIKLSNNWETYDNIWNCYRPNGFNMPESCAQLNFQARILDNFTWDSEKLNSIIEGIPWATINWWMLGIDNQNSDEMMALLEKANADAKERAEKTAKAIWAKLWKLIVFSEDSDWYRYNNYVTTLPKDLQIEWMAVVHHTYSVK